MVLSADSQWIAFLRSRFIQCAISIVPLSPRTENT